MRVNPNQSSSLISDMQQTQQSLATAVDQLASGKRVATPSDDPMAFAANLRSLASTANLDRYSKNAETILSRAHMADSALSGVVTSLTRALSFGTQGASGSISAAGRATLAAQVQGTLAEVVAQANLSTEGTAVFGGTALPPQAFTADPAATSGFTYNGNSGTNQASIGDGLRITVNVPGDQVFMSPEGNVLGSLTQLISSLQSGSASDISSATSAISAAITHVGQQRVVYANIVTQVESQESFLSQETLSLSAQQSSLTGIDLATAATNLTAAQTAHSAVLAAAAKVLPTSLLDYLK